MHRVLCVILAVLVLYGVASMVRSPRSRQPVYDWPALEAGLERNRSGFRDNVAAFGRIQVIMNELVVFRDEFYKLPSLDVRSEEMVRIIESTLVANETIKKTFTDVGSVYDDIEKAMIARDIDDVERQMKRLPPLHDITDTNLDVIKSNLQLIDIRQNGLKFKFKFSQPTKAPDLWGFLYILFYLLRITFKIIFIFFCIFSVWY